MNVKDLFDELIMTSDPITANKVRDAEILIEKYIAELADLLVDSGERIKKQSARIAELEAQVDSLQRDLISIYQSAGNDLAVYQLKKLRGEA